MLVTVLDLLTSLAYQRVSGLANTNLLTVSVASRATHLLDYLVGGTGLDRFTLGSD